MNRRLSFDDALDAALEALRSGERLESVLDLHVRHAGVLRPMLETASALGVHATPAPPQPLRANFAIVRSALRDARGDLARTNREARAWWLRPRVTFASFSLPLVAVAAIALTGAGGAAAATFTVAEPAVMRHAAGAIAPHWLRESVPAFNRDDNGGSPPVPTVEPTSPLSGAADAQPSATAPSPAEDEITVAGAIRSVHGGTFVMKGTSGDWHVVTDQNTSITGVVAEGAIATVRGRASGNALHAVAILVTDENGATNGVTPEAGGVPTVTPPSNGGDVPEDAATPHGNSGNAPGQSGTPPGNSGDAPGQSSTPPGNSGNAPGQNKTATPGDPSPGNDKTPPGQAEKTKTPPGQGHDNGGGPKKP